MLAIKATLMWAAFGRKGFTKIDAIEQDTGVFSDYNQPISYTGILDLLGQLSISESTNNYYTPLKY